MSWRACARRNAVMVVAARRAASATRSRAAYAAASLGDCAGARARASRARSNAWGVCVTAAASCTLASSNEADCDIRTSAASRSSWVTPSAAATSRGRRRAAAWAVKPRSSLNRTPSTSTCLRRACGARPNRHLLIQPSAVGDGVRCRCRCRCRVACRRAEVSAPVESCFSIGHSAAAQHVGHSLWRGSCGGVESGGVESGRCGRLRRAPAAARAGRGSSGGTHSGPAPRGGRRAGPR
jgi:hypothetical protein